MDLTYEILLTLHGIAGVIALVTYWSAALLRKGSPAHRTVGRTYLLSMLVIVITAAPMAVLIAMKGRPGIATFLGYLVVITSTGMWNGWRAIRRKGQQQAFRDGAYAAVAWLNVVVSVVVFTVGWQMSQVLLMGFSMVGLLGGAQMLYLRARPMASSRWWMEEHFSAMVGCGVATHIAFLAIGLDRIVRMAGIEPPSWYHLIAWFLPLSLSFVAVPLLRRKYNTAPVARPA